MSRYVEYSKKTIEKLWAEGRGKGHGANYKPWIMINDFPSDGRSHRVLNPFTGRTHHFFSDLEKRYYYWPGNKSSNYQTMGFSIERSKE